MDDLLSWIIRNKEWLFSGVGVVVVAWIGRIIYKGRQAAPTQNIRSGSNSTNIQVGRDVNINNESKRKDVGQEK